MTSTLSCWTQSLGPVLSPAHLPASPLVTVCRTREPLGKALTLPVGPRGVLPAKGRVYRGQEQGAGLDEPGAEGGLSLIPRAQEMVSSG